MLFLVLWSNIQSYVFLFIQSSGLGLRVPVYGSSSLISVKDGQGEKNKFSKTRGAFKALQFLVRYHILFSEQALNSL